MGKRIEYIDICKALAIFAMVFCHVGMRMHVQDANLERQIHLWHMPIFFVLSGVVLNPAKWMGWNNWWKFVQNRAKTIMLPYLFWGGILNIYLFVVSNYIKKGDKVLTMNDFFLTSFDFSLNTISAFRWFLPAMFFTELLFVIISNVLGTKKKVFLLYVLIACLGMYGGQYFIMKLPLAFDVLPFTLGFLGFGYLFKDKILGTNYRSRWISCLLIFFVASWYFLPVCVNVRTSLYSPLYFSWGICIVITLSIIALIKHIESDITSLHYYDSIKFLGRNTLLIYLLHYEIIRLLPLKKIMIENVLLSSLVQFLITIEIIVCLGFAIRFINKHLAWTIGKF